MRLLRKTIAHIYTTLWRGAALRALWDARRAATARGNIMTMCTGDLQGFGSRFAPWPSATACPGQKHWPYAYKHLAPQRAFLRVVYE